jgi:transposase InsO family protein
VKFAFIDAEKACFPITFMCRMLEVSASGYYTWRGRGDSQRTIDDQKLTVHIRAIFKQFHRDYGSPRIHKELQAMGIRVGKKRVERLMAQEGLVAKQSRKFKTTTDSSHNLPVSPNLVGREPVITAPNQVWVADITYIPTVAGWAYLAIVLDLYSRAVVGWALRSHMKSSLVIEALQMAIRRRRPPRGLIHHSDRGSQYASEAFRAELAKHGILSSMSRKGDCYDNAFAESFFHSLKVERTHHRCYLTCEDVGQDIDRYVDGYYNPIRRHSSLGYESPMDYEREAVQRKTWWTGGTPIRASEMRTATPDVPPSRGGEC